MLNDTFFTITEITKLLKVSRQAVNQWIKCKKLPAYKAGKLYRIKNADLKKFLKTRK